VGFDPGWCGSMFCDTCLFGSGLDPRGSGGPGLGHVDSTGLFLRPGSPSLRVSIWPVMVPGWLGLLVPLVMVLALAVLVAVALVVLEMASLNSVSVANGTEARSWC